MHGILVNERRIKIPDIAEMVGICFGHVHYISHVRLGKKILSQRNICSQPTKCATCENFYATFQRNPVEFYADL